jgi:hypothetical protein
LRDVLGALVAAILEPLSENKGLLKPCRTWGNTMQNIVEQSIDVSGRDVVRSRARRESCIVKNAP